MWDDERGLSGRYLLASCIKPYCFQRAARTTTPSFRHSSPMCGNAPLIDELDSMSVARWRMEIFGRGNEIRRVSRRIASGRSPHPIRRLDWEKKKKKKHWGGRFCLPVDFFCIVRKHVKARGVVVAPAMQPAELMVVLWVSIALARVTRVVVHAAVGGGAERGAVTRGHGLDRLVRRPPPADSLV